MERRVAAVEDIGDDEGVAICASVARRLLEWWAGCGVAKEEESLAGRAAEGALTSLTNQRSIFCFPFFVVEWDWGG